MTLRTILFTRASHPRACVYPGFCSHKHSAVAVVSAKIREENGSVLRYHSEYTACLGDVFFLPADWLHFCFFVAILRPKMELQCDCLDQRFKFFFLKSSLPLSSGSCPSPWCWSSSPTLWWPMWWLSPLDSVWLPHSCFHGKTVETNSSLLLYELCLLDY